MARLLLFLISLAIVGFIAYYYVTGQATRGSHGEPPAQTLQNVRESAKKIEADSVQRAADIEHKTDGQ